MNFKSIHSFFPAATYDIAKAMEMDWEVIPAHKGF